MNQSEQSNYTGVKAQLDHLTSEFFRAVASNPAKSRPTKIYADCSSTRVFSSRTRAQNRRYPVLLSSSSLASPWCVRAI